MNKEELDRHRRLLIEKVKELQQENKHLNLQLDQPLKEYEELQIRIEKAIEYIKKYLPNYDFDHSNLEKLLEKLLEILGEKENE